MKNLFAKFLTIFIFTSCCNVLAQTKDYQYSNQPITIAINKTSYPYHYQDEKGQAAGVMIDLWRLWANKQGIEVEFIFKNWSQTLSLVSEHEIDIHAGMVKTEDRQQDFSFTSPFFKQTSHIYLQLNYSHIENISQLQPLTIGVVEGSSHIEKINNLNPHLTLRLYKDMFALFDGALNGEVAAFSHIDETSRNYPRRQELLVQFPPYNRLFLRQNDYVSAVAKDNDQLLQFIEEGLSKISHAEKSKIEKKWLGFDQHSDKLRLGFTPNLLPYMGVSATGKAQGLFVDIWRLWSKRTGLDVEFVPEKMSDVEELIKEGALDAHISYPNSNLSIEEITRATEVYAVPSNVYISVDTPDVRQLSQLSGKRMGVFTTAPYKEQIINDYPQIDLKEFNNYQEVLKAIENKEIDAFVGAVETTVAQLIKADLNSEFYSLENSPFRTKIYALTQKKNTRLVEIIKEGFDMLPLDELLKLEKRWLLPGEDGYYKLKALKVELSSKENAFLQNHSTIKVGVNQSWRPVEFMDENGFLQGINSDINNLVMQRTGLNFSYHYYDNWNEMFQGLLNKEIDILGSTTQTMERQKSLLFTDSYWDMPWVVIHQRQNGKQLKIKDFYGKELAIVKGYHLAETIIQKHPSIILKIVNSHEEGVQAVQQGLVEGLIENIASASELIRRESLITLYMSVVDEFNIDKNSYAIRKDWPQLKSIIDKALMTISENEKQVIYEKWFGINIETGFDKDVVLRLSAQIGVIIIAIIIIIIIWNRRLYVEIQTRKSLEVKMKHMATHDELTGLANRVLLKDRINTAISFHQRQSLQMAVLFIDLDGFKTINDTYGHDVGDELLIQVADKLSGCVRKSDTIVRFGGDEFVLLLTGLHNREEAAFIAEKVLKLVQQPFHLSLVEANIGCSIGISMYPDDGKTDTDLLKEADRLMYKVKAAGKNHYVFNS
ncbi:MAG: transporter substrate-binding domain-containing protein [Colwelliaceae bacterium]|nr:transporter substrate-binding domain-containing protein [Colwelliaceae bacterium]